MHLNNYIIYHKDFHLTISYNNNDKIQFTKNRKMIRLITS